MHSFGDWLTGNDCMNDDKLMNDNSDESVSWYKNTPDKKMLYIVSIKKNTLIMPALCSMLQHTIMLKIMPA